MDREKLYEKVKECKKNGDSLGVIAVKCLEGDVRLFDLVECLEEYDKNEKVDQELIDED